VGQHAGSARAGAGNWRLVALATEKFFWKISDFALTNANLAIVCWSANGRSRVPRGVLLGSTRAAFVGFSKWAASVVESKRERLIFESAILDFVITTIQLFEIQKVEVSEN
jgi:hypothetical protein